MKRTTVLSKLNLILLSIVGVLVLCLVGIILFSSSSNTNLDHTPDNTVIPVSGISLDQPGQIQNPITGLQNTSPVTSSQLNQLQSAQ